MIRLFFLAVGIFLSTHSSAQLADTLFVAAASKNAISINSKAVGEHSNLFNGGQYIEYKRQKDEHPYLVDDWSSGDLFYDSELYTDVPLLYDMEKDQAVTYYLHGNQYVLVPEKVRYFHIGKSRFVRLTSDKIEKGYYEVLYDGRETKYYLRRQRVRSEVPESNVIVKKFETRTKYYLYKDGEYHNVKGKKAVMSHLRDRERDLKKFVREESLSFGKEERDGSIVKLLQHYDQIK